MFSLLGAEQPVLELRDRTLHQLQLFGVRRTDVVLEAGDEDLVLVRVVHRVERLDQPPHRAVEDRLAADCGSASSAVRVPTSRRGLRARCTGCPCCPASSRRRRRAPAKGSARAGSSAFLRRSRHGSSTSWKFGLPCSSAPSHVKITFTGSLPSTAMIDSMALRMKRLGPLLFTAPRATIGLGEPCEVLHPLRGRAAATTIVPPPMAACRTSCRSTTVLGAPTS